ncbi:CHAT domain-containing protein [Stackebrandtia endophytica]|uniref:CHAT domain-containing protein n=1 Tax=Stackebrandtia endophytica TaxID=1496996 RepID=UPI0014776E8F|nr:CHAT domain-containing protein [Stackebrandtia endophytica]
MRRSNRGHRTDGHHFRTLRRLTWAELEVARGDRSAALKHLRIGLNQLHEHRARLGSMEMQAGMTSLGRKLAEKGIELVIDSNRAGTIFSWSERSRAQAFRLPPASPPEDSEIAEILARVRKLRNEIREAELVGDPVAELRSQCRIWERQLREHSWHASGSGKSVPLVKIGQVHQELARWDQALVSFVADRGYLHALVLGDGRTSHVRLGPVDEVAEANRRLLVDLTAATGRKLPGRMLDVVRRSIQHQANVLGKVLLEPVLPLVGAKDLVVVPAQAMASLPWGVLPQLAGRPVTVSPSASVWWSAVRRESRRAGPTLLASGPDLTHAEEELTAIAGLRPDSLVLRDRDATPSAILAALDGASLAHLAAHGYHEPENVLFSRLDFADGPLMAYDIARLSTPPAHVTLSACDVGQSTVTIGDESLGFTAALLHAGTDTVVSSVTKVEHSAAADVMTAYHAGLVAGHRPARALAEASARQPFTSFVCYGAG